MWTQGQAGLFKDFDGLPDNLSNDAEWPRWRARALQEVRIDMLRPSLVGRTFLSGHNRSKGYWPDKNLRPTSKIQLPRRISEPGKLMMKRQTFLALNSISNVSRSILAGSVYLRTSTTV